MTPTPLPDLLVELERGIAELTTSDRWLRFLNVQSRFHDYSFANALLIASQRESATRVAGYHTWRQLERYVRKGEKAIWIFAPIFVGRDGDEAALRGFKLVPVFDIEQTDGMALETVVRPLTTDDELRHFDALVEVARALGFTVCNVHFGGTTNGDCSHIDRRIRVEETNQPAQRVKTLAHELAHAVLHQHIDSRARAELEAESVAYIVCQTLGIDSSEYSFGYVATWAGGGHAAITGIKESCAQIQRAAASILELLDPEWASATNTTAHESAPTDRLHA